MNSAEFCSKLGVWIAAAGGLLMAFNAFRSLSKPVPFATYLGLPLAHEGDAAPALQIGAQVSASVGRNGLAKVSIELGLGL